MKNSFLDAKIQKPWVSPDFIYRPRLIDRLQDTDKRLIVLHATVGYGKTVLLTHFGENTAQVCAWNNMNISDNDSIIFMQYLSASLNKVLPAFDFDVRTYTASFQAEEILDTALEEFVSRLNEALSTVPYNINLILDDFQAIDNESVFYIIQVLIARSAKNLRILIATKSAVPPFCFRYILEGTADIIKQSDLSFTFEEICSLFRILLQEETNDSLVKTIWHKSEGWPAGVMFAYLHLKQQEGWPANQNSIWTCQKTALDTYFMHELFKKIPYDIQTFLINTSLLEFLNKELCNSVLHIENSQSMLLYLERENLFTSRVGQTDGCFRYHSLFKEFLESMAQPEKRQEILTRAAEFYLKTPEKEAAVEYAMSAGNWDLMQFALETVGNDFTNQGKLAPLSRWLSVLEENQIKLSAKNTLLAGSYFYRTGQAAKAARYLDQAQELFLSSMDELGYIYCVLEQARMARNQKSLAESSKLIEEILPLMDANYSHLWYEVVGERLYNFVYKGRYREALAICSEMILNTRQAGNKKAEGSFMRFSTIVYFYMGKYQKGLKLYQNLLDNNWITRDEDRLISVESYVALMYLFTGQKEAALKTIQHELERNNRFPFGNDNWLVYLIQAYIQMVLASERNNDGLRQAFLLNEAQKFLHMAERHVTGLGKNPEFLSSVNLMQEILHLYSSPQEWSNAAERIHRFADKAIPLARNMALSSAAVILYQAGSWAEAQETAQYISACEWEDAFTFKAQAVMALVMEKAGDKEEIEKTLANICACGLDEQLMQNYLPEQLWVTFKKLIKFGGDKGNRDQIKVACFGDFRVWLPGENLEIKWRTKKAQELFAFLFHLQGQAVDKDQILLQLWPDFDRKNATSLLHTSIYSIRKILAHYHLEDLIIYQDKKYAMQMSLISSDYAQLNLLSQAFEEGDEVFIYDYRHMLDCYQGEYMAGIDCDFCQGRRGYFEKRFLELSLIVARAAIRKKRWGDALNGIERAISVDPYDEELYLLALECCRYLKDIKQAKRLFKQLQATLLDELEVDISPEIEEAYRLCLEAGARKRTMAAI